MTTADPKKVLELATLIQSQLPHNFEIILVVLEPVEDDKGSGFDVGVASTIDEDLAKTIMGRLSHEKETDIKH